MSWFSQVCAVWAIVLLAMAPGTGRKCWPASRAQKAADGLQDELQVVELSSGLGSSAIGMSSTLMSQDVLRQQFLNRNRHKTRVRIDLQVSKAGRSLPCLVPWEHSSVFTCQLFMGTSQGLATENYKIDYLLFLMSLCIIQKYISAIKP